MIIQVTKHSSLSKPGLSDSEKGAFIAEMQEMIHGLRALRGVLTTVSTKHCERLTCQEIEELLAPATKYLSTNIPQSYELLRHGMIDVAQPVLRAAASGDKRAREQKNIMMGMLELRVATGYLPINLLIALRFPFSEAIITTLEALRILRSELHKQDIRSPFNSYECTPRTMAEWLRDIPAHARGTLKTSCYSAVETLLLFAYRNNATRAREQTAKWFSYRGQERQHNQRSHASPGVYLFHTIMSI